jgi:hypothetical protein
VEDEMRGVETRLLVPLVRRGVGCSDGEMAVGCGGALRCETLLLICLQRKKKRGGEDKVEQVVAWRDPGKGGEGRLTWGRMVPSLSM